MEVSIQLVSPASGELNPCQNWEDAGQLCVSIQLVSPASGELNAGNFQVESVREKFPFN